MAALTSTQIVAEINTLVDALVAIPGRANAVGGGGGGGADTLMKTPWNADQFNLLATTGGVAATGIAGAPGATRPPAAAPVWGDYLVANYNAIRGVGVGANQSRDRARMAVLEFDFRLPNGNLRNILIDIFNSGHVINPATGKLIYNVPKSDELLRRFVSPLFGKKSGMEYANAAAALAEMQGETFKSMPKSDSDIYISFLRLGKETLEALVKYDERVDLIRTALSRGIVSGPSTIPPGNIVAAPVKNSVSSFTRFPPGLQEILRQRRKSDPSNPLGTVKPFERIRISMNGGANNMTGGSRAGPLYPKLVMHGGAHPFAVMEGGAAPGPARGNPNPVAVLDARIKELEAQFKSATGKDLSNAVGGPINGYADTVNNTVVDLRKDLELLSKANSALSQYPVGLGIDASTFDKTRLQQISDQADSINKQAAKASKQLDKLTQIKDTLEELVSKVNPAART